MHNYFRSVDKTGKNVGYSKMNAVVLISHFRSMLIVIFSRINCDEE